MEGFRFYKEFEDKRKGISDGNVIAVIHENVRQDGSLEAIGAVFYHPNSAVAGTDVSREFLQEHCKRISEAKAREIHPALFDYLDYLE